MQRTPHPLSSTADHIRISMCPLRVRAVVVCGSQPLWQTVRRRVLVSLRGSSCNCRAWTGWRPVRAAPALQREVSTRQPALRMYTHRLGAVGRRRLIRVRRPAYAIARAQRGCGGAGLARDDGRHDGWGEVRRAPDAKVRAPGMNDEGLLPAPALQ